MFIKSLSDEGYLLLAGTYTEPDFGIYFDRPDEALMFLNLAGYISVNTKNLPDADFKFAYDPKYDKNFVPVRESFWGRKTIVVNEKWRDAGYALLSKGFKPDEEKMLMDNEQTIEVEISKDPDTNSYVSFILTIVNAEG